MATRKKTGGRDFAPGVSGNPGGRPRLPEAFKNMRFERRLEVERIFGKYAWCTPSEIAKAAASKDLPIIESIVARILNEAHKGADTWRLEFILNRIIGRVSNEDPLIFDPEPVKPARQAALTFAEFCENARYPKPYPRQYDMKDFAMTDGEPRLLMGARGYGKSDYVTVLGEAYQVYLDWFFANQDGRPLEETCLIISKSKTRNSAMIGEIAEALRANGVPLEKSNSTCIRVEGLIGKDHSVEVITIKSSFRGRHPKRIIMDDPVTEEDTSEAMRTLVKKKYDEAYKLCKNIVIIGQPAHAFDLYAELEPLLNTMKVPHGEIPELDADLNAMLLAGIDSNSIEMSYRLKIPKDGASIFGNIRYCDQLIQGPTLAFLDPSDGGDYTAISIFRGHLQGMGVFGKVWKKAWYHCIDDFVQVLVERNVQHLVFEINSTGRQPIEQLRTVLAPHGITVVGQFSDDNKHEAILAAGSISHMIHLSKESDRAYTDQVVKYEKRSKHDDAPDSLARGLQYLGLLKKKRKKGT